MRLTNEELIKKYRPEMGKDPEKSRLLADKFPHCLLVIEGAEELLKMPGCENRAKDYLDSIIIRLHVSLSNLLLPAWN